MTKEELFEAIKTNPHLAAMRETYHRHPELAIQTFANELKVPVQDVADALGVTIVLHTEEAIKNQEHDGKELGGIVVAEAHGRPVLEPQRGKVVAGALSAEGKAEVKGE